MRASSIAAALCKNILQGMETSGSNTAQPQSTLQEIAGRFKGLPPEDGPSFAGKLATGAMQQSSAGRVAPHKTTTQASLKQISIMHIGTRPVQQDSMPVQI